MTQRKKMLWASFAQQWKDLLIQAHAYIYITAAYCFRKLEPYLDPSVSGHVAKHSQHWAFVFLHGKRDGERQTDERRMCE